MLLPNEIVYAFTFFLACGLFLHVWPRRHVQGGRYLLGQQLALILWVFGLFFEAFSTDVPTKILWSQICYIGFVAIAPFFFLFILSYSSQARIRPFVVISLFIFPAFVLAAAWTNQWHHLVWSSIHPGSSQYNTLIYEHGSLYFIHAIYLYLLVFGSVGLLLLRIPKSHAPFRFQLIIILISCLFPILSGSLYLFNFDPVPGMDISSFGFLLTNIIFVYGFARYQLLDLVPTARDLIVERFRDGMIVVDWKNRVVEANQPAKDLLGIKPQNILGKNIKELLPVGINLEKLSKENLPTEYCLSEEQPTYIDVQVSNLSHGYSASSGYLLVLRNISARKRTELQLKIANAYQQDRINEIKHFQQIFKDQATHDALTGLYNRRPLEEILARQLMHARQHQQYLAIIIIDVDHFKNINDQYGHLAGDGLLEKYGKCILGSARLDDFSCRFGGDEFLMAFLNMPLPEARKKAENIRQKMQAILLELDGKQIGTTVSIGISIFPTHGDSIDDLIRLADEGLYIAKEKGRNQVGLATLKQDFQVS